MGRNSRAKKERRAAERRSKAGSAKKPAHGGLMQLVTVPLGNDHGPYDDCPICVAMREMGLKDGVIRTEGQMARLRVAMREAEAAGGIVLRPPQGTN